MNTPDKIIEKVVGVARELDQLAVEGYEYAADDRCVALFGTVRDCAYRVINAAENEVSRHARLAKKASDGTV